MRVSQRGKTIYKKMNQISSKMDYSIEELTVLVKPIAEKYGVKRMYLFGSRARGDGNSESDYDFCITPCEGSSLLTLSGIMIDLKEALGSEVDIVCEKYLEGEFRNRVEIERKLIYAV